MEVLNCPLHVPLENLSEDTHKHARGRTQVNSHSHSHAGTQSARLHTWHQFCVAQLFLFLSNTPNDQAQTDRRTDAGTDTDIDIANIQTQAHPPGRTHQADTRTAAWQGSNGQS